MTVRAARLTPAGTGAIATVAVVGDEAWQVLKDLFQPVDGTNLETCPPPGSLHFGHFGSSNGDEVVLAHRPNTGEPWLEVHCHGGREVVAWIIEQLQDRGAMVVDWQELERLETQSWIRAIAAASLTRALTVKTASILLDQQQGALDRELSTIRNAMKLGHSDEAKLALHELLSTAQIGLHLTEPFRIALFGPPNVGKSSLINRIVGYERAVVSPRAGTTRELTTTLTAIDGWPMEFFDSPGIRASDDQLEAEGVRRGLAALSQRSFDLSIWVVDRSTPSELPRDLDQVFSLVIVNKCDLPPEAFPISTTLPVIELSALTGEGLDTLQSWLAKRLTGDFQSGRGVLFTSELAEAVTHALKHLNEGHLERSQQVLDALIQPEKSQFPLSMKQPGNRSSDDAT